MIINIIAKHQIWTEQKNSWIMTKNPCGLWVGFGLIVTHRYRWWRGVWWQCTEAGSWGRPAARRNWRRWERWQPAWSDTWWGRHSITTGSYRTKRQNKQDFIRESKRPFFVIHGAVAATSCGADFWDREGALSVPSWLHIHAYTKSWWGGDSEKSTT